MSNNTQDEKTEIEIHVTALNITSETFGRLYDVHVKPIFRFIYFKVNSREEAEDLTSETFLKAWDYISRSGQTNKIQNLRAFFYQIASNLVVDYYRTKALLPLSLDAVSGSDSDIADSKISGIEKISQNDEIKDLKKSLKNIPENYCDIIIWYYLEDLKIAEIAAIIQKSEGAVRVLVHRALKSLKKELEKIEKEKKSSLKISAPLSELRLEMEPAPEEISEEIPN